MRSAERDVMTVALEDYFQAVSFRHLIQPSRWYRFERRVEQNTRKALALLDEFDVKATFFASGWIAEQIPELIREVAERGHEVATKGYSHRGIAEMTPAEFREDLIRSRETIERASGTRVLGHRIGRGRLGLGDLWALDVLCDEGFAYDSSFYPRLRSLAPEPWRRFAHLHRRGSATLAELPLATARLGPWLLPIAGGNCLRQLPHALMRRAIERWHRDHPDPFVMHFHVWELDAELPQITAAPGWVRVRQYRHLDRMPALLRYYLARYRFVSARACLGLEREPARAAAPVRPAAGAVGSPAPQRTREPVTIVVPCYNEQSALPYLANTLERVRTELEGTYELHFLFVDDGSSDDTAPLLHSLFSHWPNARILRHERNRGVAAAILTGIRAAETETVCSIDCDGTYDPLQLRELLPRLVEGVAMVTASPYHPSGRVLNVPRWRLGLSKGLSALYRRVAYQKLHTYTSCFRVYRRSALQDLELRDGGFLGIAEMLAALDRRGARIAEQPAVLEVRMLGHSKMRLLRTLRGHLGLLARLALGRWLGPAPVAAEGERLAEGRR